MVVPKSVRQAISEAILNTVWMTPLLNVALVCQWIKDGTADRVIELKRAAATERFALVEQILHDYSSTGQPSGFFIWLKLPPPWSGQSFEQRMRALGINVFGAEKFTVGDAPAPAAVRISLTGAKNMSELEAGLTLVRQVLDGERPSDIKVMR